MEPTTRTSLRLAGVLYEAGLGWFEKRAGSDLMFVFKIKNLARFGVST